MEIKDPIHYTNRSGVRARPARTSTSRMNGRTRSLADAGFQGSLRQDLRQHEWRRLNANDSLEWRNCHNFEFMDFTRQSARASQFHSTALANGEATCIDCHKGIAHRLPDMHGVPGW